MTKTARANTNKLTPAERGRLGGQATAQRHGPVHMEAIGRSGFWATVNRHFAGDAGLYLVMLRSHSVAARKKAAPQSIETSAA